MAAAATRATVQALGATAVTLRICGGKAAGAAVEGLGLVAPLMESIRVSPVLVRMAAEGTREVLVDAGTLKESVQAEGEALRNALMQARVEVDGVEKRIVSIGAESLGGAVYLYRLGLEA